MDHKQETNKIKIVKVDSSVVLNIIKHASDHQKSITTGHLLGVDTESGVLEIASSFPLPKGDDSSSASSYPKSKSNQKYIKEMSEKLGFVNVVSNPAGWYLNAYNGTGFYCQATIDTLLSYREVTPSGPNTVVLVYDGLKTIKSGLCLKAFYLSDNFLAAHKDGGKFTTELINKHGLNYKNILVEVPVEITNSHLCTTLIQQLSDLNIYENPYSNPVEDSFLESTELNAPLYPNYDLLDISVNPYLETNIKSILGSIDDYFYDLSNLNYFQRQTTREQSKIAQWQQKRKAENALRATTGKPPLPEDEWKKIFKLPQQPSRLDSLLIAAQIGQYANQVTEFSAADTPKMLLVENASSTEN